MFSIDCQKDWAKTTMGLGVINDQQFLIILTE
jgi:hypothetical protein